MVGRNSSMLLMAFCMTTSNTHSRGRHSSSISLVDAAGKYLEKQRGSPALRQHLAGAEGRSSTHGLQLLIRAFRRCSSELQPSRGEVVSTVSLVTRVHLANRVTQGTLRMKVSLMVQNPEDPPEAGVGEQTHLGNQMSPRCSVLE